MRTGTRESPSWPGLDPETGYVDADCSDQISETSCRRGGPYVFKSLLRIGVLLRVVWPRLQARQSHPSQQLAHCPLVHHHLVARLDHRAQVEAAPPHHAILDELRASKNQVFQLLH